MASNTADQVIQIFIKLLQDHPAKKGKIVVQDMIDNVNSENLHYQIKHLIRSCPLSCTG